ncbi:MAG TPA: hypothetical protein VF786_06275 [Terriglobales bacterium]
MKRLLMTGLFVALILLGVSCGTNSNKNNNVSGNWTATLTGTNGSPNFAFTLTMFQNSDNTISVTNLNFTTASPCFAGGATANGGFTLSGNFNGNVNGALTLVVQSNTSPTNTLNLNGTVQNNNISGTWTLVGGSGCTGAGNFTMIR